MYELPKAKNRDVRSFAFVTMHKAGSSIADRIFRVYAKQAGLVPANLAERAKAVGAQEGEFCRDNADKLSANGYYFGPFRGVYVADMGGFHDNRLVVQMRDPRDCICSHYFSMGWSHQLPKTQERQAHFLRMRDQVQSQEIDEYAINTTHQYLRRMEVIRDIIDAHDDVLLLSYETMVTDTPAWCAQIESFLGIERTPRLNRALRGLLDFNVDSEDASKHKRQVTPGDHRRKLLPETLEKMNETLQPVLDRFSYAR